MIYKHLVSLKYIFKKNKERDFPSQKKSR